MLIICVATAAAAADSPDDLIRRADKLQRDKPTPTRALAILELRRAAGAPADPPRAPGDLPKPAPARDAILEATAWRMIPTAPADRPALDALLTMWTKTGSKSPWLGVLRLYAASVAGDRAALLAAAKSLTDLPAAFPSAAAEQAHFELLKELGLDENSAGLEVLSHRSFVPLHALLDLDRALTRDVELLQGTTRTAEAKLLQTCRDRLRQAWLDASRHLVERLFALHVLGRDPECDALLFAARDLPYLTDPAELNRVLARLDKSQALTLLIAPLLASEVALIQSPPKLPTVTPAAVAELVVEAKNKSIQTGISTYEGTVRARIGRTEIACDKLATLGDSPASARILSGAGNVSIKSAAGFDLMLADAFTLNLDTGAYSLGGSVRLTRDGRTQKVRAATIGRSGDVRDAVSLLDDFDAAPDAAARLAMLPKLTNAYTDDELPPAVRYLLALNLLRPHLTWRRAEGAGNAPPLESFLRDDAAAQLRGANAVNANPVETMLEKSQLTCALKNGDHPDVARACQLIANITDGDLGTRVRWWHERVLAR